ncbi:MAG TPA: hypothetical protein VHU13_01050 [Solirubrobacteraceae bacterium]|jgi:hypothetical protein|nr:hypothetical protein [Solirubrobacteraceae bacterium]
MHEAGKASGLRERLTSHTEDRLGKAITDLFENPLVSSTIGRAFDARERAAQAQELALSALNIPTAADIERLTRRLRSVSQRLEGIEDGVHRLNRALADGGVERRLAAMEEQLKTLSARLAGESRRSAPAAASAPRSAAAKASAPKTARAKRTSATKSTSPRRAAARKPAGAKPARKRASSSRAKRS